MCILAWQQVDWSSVEKLELQHNYLERLPKFGAPRLRELSIRYNGPLFQFEDDDVAMFTKERWPALEVSMSRTLLQCICCDAYHFVPYMLDDEVKACFCTTNEHCVYGLHAAGGM